MLNSTHKKEQKQKKMENVIQINEQCCMWKYSGKLKK